MVPRASRRIVVEHVHVVAEGRGVVAALLLHVVD
jgi:hypothetical protein